MESESNNENINVGKVQLQRRGCLSWAEVSDR